MKGQLYQLVNDSYVFPVHVQNVTDVKPGPTDGRDPDEVRYPLPYRLVFGDRQDDYVKDGYWTWYGTTLRYNHGAATNGGLFYECTINKAGSKNLFFALKWCVSLDQARKLLT